MFISGYIYAHERSPHSDWRACDLRRIWCLLVTPHTPTETEPHKSLYLGMAQVRTRRLIGFEPNKYKWRAVRINNIVARIPSLPPVLLLGQTLPTHTCITRDVGTMPCRRDAVKFANVRDRDLCFLGKFRSFAAITSPLPHTSYELAALNATG